ncbi:hypothetical protein [Deinococcus navajonensis]|uniref:Uncharacterized protein n=1 Tax=Deinococcus navajonensis TaxID=309884 RepID=A0ABV8XTS3_9DEIO
MRDALLTAAALSVLLSAGAAWAGPVPERANASCMAYLSVYAPMFGISRPELAALMRLEKTENGPAHAADHAMNKLDATCFD